MSQHPNHKGGTRKGMAIALPTQEIAYKRYLKKTPKQVTLLFNKSHIIIYFAKKKVKPSSYSLCPLTFNVF
jgi:hypothetical protein